MLCPEISKFEVSESTCKFENINNEKSLLANPNINTFYYNHLVSVILPDSLHFPNNLTEKLILDCEYYKISDLNLSDLVNTDFLKYFINCGDFTLLTVNTKIDCDNCIGVVPSGHLILSVNKDTYQSLGLEGKVSHFTKKNKDKYIVKINLKEDYLKPGKPKYERIKSNLQKLGRFTAIISWEPYGNDICPSSVAKFFSDLGYKVTVSSPKFLSNTTYSVKVPKPPFDNGEEDVADFIEWLGMISLDCDMNPKDPENYQSSFVTPQPNKEYGQVKFLQWRGFFSVEKIKEFIEDLAKYVKVANKPWVSIYVQGFSDSAVAWGCEEHHYYTNGDNSYIVILDNMKYLLCTQKCSKKRYK